MEKYSRKNARRIVVFPVIHFALMLGIRPREERTHRGPSLVVLAGETFRLPVVGGGR